MSDSPITLSDLLTIIAILTPLFGGLAFMFKLSSGVGSKLDRLALAIEHLTFTIGDHEERLRELEHSKH